MTNKPQVQLPNPEKIDKRFHFVTDDILRKNISNVFSYIIFLDSLESDLQLPDLFKIMVYKTMIIYSASIVESLLYFKLKTMLTDGRIDYKDISGRQYKYEEISKVILKIKYENPIVLCEKLLIKEKLKPNSQFHNMAIYAKRCGLLTDSLFKECNYIKNLRNKIHLSAMNSIDNSYSRESVNDIFAKVKRIITRIEEF